MIYAIDFDGVITKTDEFPDIGDPNLNVINKIKELKSNSHQIILWTSREGPPQDRVLKWMKDNFDLEFDAVNQNIPGIVDKFEGDESRKIYANYYIDDKNLSIGEFLTQ